MKIYIAGKVTGDSAYREKFQRAEQTLEDQGFTVISPAVLPEGMNPADCMRICFAMIDSADIVAFLPDRGRSSGACLEHEWCRYVGKQMMYLGAEKPKPKTYRDVVAERAPQCIGSDRLGGVVGCPGIYFRNDGTRFCIGDCDSCWNRPYQGEKWIYTGFLGQ